MTVNAHALTHAHPDHQGASDEVCGKLRIPFWVGEGDVELAERPELIAESQPAALNRLAMRYWVGPGRNVDRVLREGDDVAGFRVIDVPGHSPGHVVFWREADRVLIIGDVLNSIDIFTGVRGLNEPKAEFTADPAENRRSARKLAPLEPSLVCFGHGPPLRDLPTSSSSSRACLMLGPSGCQTCAGMADDRLKTLEERTRYEPTEVEGRDLRALGGGGDLQPQPEGTAAENYSIAVPPPNVTGNLHMGHALNASIQDACIRVARMRGRRAKWIFGTDHAGIATQRQVEKRLEGEGTSREEIGREEFIARVWRGARSTATRSLASSRRSAPPWTTATSASRWTTTTCVRSLTCSCASTRRA